MKLFRSFRLALLLTLLGTGTWGLAESKIPNGRQPSVSVDQRGIVRMVYGFQDSIFCVTSQDQGSTFSKPALVAVLPGLYLGMACGPQLASSRTFSMVTAIDKKGTIHSYCLNHRLPNWQKLPTVNDSEGSAGEGLMSLTADTEDNFYAVWLDMREDKKNTVHTATYSNQQKGWSPNRLVYKSPEGTVCECCRPTILFRDNKLSITFRNWLGGARDIYYVVSTDRGKTFGKAAKFGNGTWKLNGCPMDGGSVSLNPKGQVVGLWRRNTDLYLAVEGQEEIKIGTGKNGSLVYSNGKAVLAWQENNRIKWTVYSANKPPVEVGGGGFPVLCALPNGKVLCAWEADKSIGYTVL
ncbi:exo-alpha-sialidase [Telluribacter sp.]|uniref:exo-alpha-sialidase n=1 Tax=Telluribacter sp. TaxID=1978767 RepID=UPI002E131D4F|nr:exo-alpha-sialidase [Telluribacter sp.]